MINGLPVAVGEMKSPVRAAVSWVDGAHDIHAYEKSIPEMFVKCMIAGQPKKGLIWHFQGSGKSLLMVFAAQELRMTPELKNPTAVIVLDRLDLFKAHLPCETFS